MKNSTVTAYVKFTIWKFYRVNDIGCRHWETVMVCSSGNRNHHDLTSCKVFMTGIMLDSTPLTTEKSIESVTTIRRYLYYKMRDYQWKLPIIHNLKLYIWPYMMEK